jgi:hypothetical protein
MSDIIENSMEGGVGGSVGTANYGNSYGTYASPDASQDPNHFEGSNANKAMGSTSNTSKNVAMSPVELKARLKVIMSKKDAPTVDGILSGLSYEMGKMIKKDKAVAKMNVITNIEKDPHYYEKLNQCNSSEEAITQNITENVNVRDGVNLDETKKIFSDMFKAHQNKYDVDSRILDAFRDSVAKKNNRKLDYQDKLD